MLSGITCAHWLPSQQEYREWEGRISLESVLSVAGLVYALFFR